MRQSIGRALALILVASGLAFALPSASQAASSLWVFTDVTSPPINIQRGDKFANVDVYCPIGQTPVAGWVNPTGDDLRRAREKVSFGDHTYYNVIVQNQTAGTETIQFTTTVRCVPRSYFTGIVTVGPVHFAHSGSTFLAAGTTTCPTGYSALSADVTSTNTSRTTLLTSSPVPGGGGWHARAWSDYPGAVLDVVVNCVPHADLVAVRRYSGSNSVGWGTAATANCATGLVPFHGGTTHNGGDQGAITEYQRPTATGWTSTTLSLSTGVIDTVVECVPSGNPTLSLSGSSGVSTSTSASWSFSGSDPAAAGGYSMSFLCTISHPGAPGTPTSCTSPVQQAALGDGVHTLSVVARTSDGRESTAAVRSVRVDTLAPTVAFTQSDGTLYGTSTPLINWMTTDASTVVHHECWLDSGTPQTCPIFNAETTGAHAIELSGVANGPHTYHVRATDEAGLVTSKALSFSVDTSAPNVTFPPQEVVRNTLTPTFQATIADTNSPVTNLLCKVDTEAVAPCGTQVGGDFRGSQTLSAVVASDGPHSLTVLAMDPTGNQTQTALEFTVDTLAPSVEFFQGQGAAFATQSPSISLAAAGTGTQVTALDCWLDSAAPSPCGTSTGGGYAGPQVVPLSGVTEGAHTLHVRATDAAGNEVTGAFAFHVDVTAPTVLFADPAGAPKGSPATFQLTVGDLSAVEQLTCALDGGSQTVCGTSSAGDFRGTQLVTLPPATGGAHALHVRAVDRAGNAVVEDLAFVVDTVAPTVTFADAPGVLKATLAPSFAVTVADAAARVTQLQCGVDGGVLGSCGSPTAGDFRGQQDLGVSVGSQGSHTIQVVATDEAGNVSLAALPFWVVTTPTGPVVTPTPPDAAPQTTITKHPRKRTTKRRAVFAFASSDAGSTFRCKVDSSAYKLCGAVFKVRVRPGRHTLRVRAVDPAGQVDPTPAVWKWRFIG